MTTNSILFDSSVLISALGTPDTFTVDSRNVFDQTRGSHIILPALVIAETVCTLAKQNTVYAELTYSTLVSSSEVILLDLPFLTKILPFASKSKLKTSDFIIAGTAKVYNATLLTWDKRLLKDTSLGAFIMSPHDYLAFTQK